MATSTTPNASDNDEHEEKIFTQNTNMILVMGVTGAGKSYFINSLAGMKAAKEGSHLDACTATCQAVPTQVGGSRVILVDTPGFDDPDRTDSEILTEISRLLAAQYTLGVNLKGVIYLHRITDVRYQRSSVKTLSIFKKICGDRALGNVILATTRWNEVDEAMGASREKDLRDKFWSYMLHNGSHMTRYQGDRDSAVGIVGELLGKGSVVLDLQRELVDDRKPLNKTAAGTLVSEDVSALKEQYESELAELEQLRRSLRESDRAMKKKIQDDWETEQGRLRRAEADEAQLQRNIAQEVRAEINREVSKTKKSPSNLPRIVSTAVGVLSLFLGLDPSARSTITDWFSDFSFDDLIQGLFSMF